MPKHNLSLSDEVRDILAQSTIEGLTLKLPGQLERKTYEAVAKALAAAGGKWNRKLEAHVFPNDPRQVLEIAVETGGIKNEKKARNAFYTPEPLAYKMAHRALSLARRLTDVTGAVPRMLEPSAGTGRLARAAKEAGAAVLCIEIHPPDCEALRKEFAVNEGDFLTKKPGANLFDAVLMNPPFENAQDIDHVTHALQFVKPGGGLVALVSPAYQFRESSAKHAEFRRLLSTVKVHEEAIPAGTFKEEGTNVATVLLTITKPKE